MALFFSRWQGSPTAVTQCCLTRFGEQIQSQVEAKHQHQQAAFVLAEKVCKQEGVPFQNNIDLAVVNVEQLQPITEIHTQVLMDSWFHGTHYMSGSKVDWDISGALKSLETAPA